MSANLQTVHPVLAANDVVAVVQFYQSLGFSVAFQDVPVHPKYVGLKRDGVELHIQWADKDQWAYPVDRPAFRFVVNNVDVLYSEFVAAQGVTGGVTPCITRRRGLRESSNGMRAARSGAARSIEDDGPLVFLYRRHASLLPPPMTKSELIRHLAARQTHLSSKDVESAVNLLLDRMGRALACQERVEIRDFGSFAIRPRPARIRRNPRNGEPVPIPAKNVLRFKPAKELRERVNVDRVQRFSL